ncbi:hypothetical protein LQ327_27805 [Actinomycetospora endophytica]|uniref:Uncharacterized protein n=1 Tax=Actinomycetospora endophytica TaxID=2291215 RepID=A0ABS8PGX2_9PSEU|nr:hypothetical protein [Actinomycetospora endophytica]MCD2197182.1 hypothetical protein [Actinomycetospora endophytica]
MGAAAAAKTTAPTASAPTEPTTRNGQWPDRAKTASLRPSTASAPPGKEKKSRRYVELTTGAAAATGAVAAAPEKERTRSPAGVSTRTRAGEDTTSTTAKVAEPAEAERTDTIVPVTDPAEAERTDTIVPVADPAEAERTDRIVPVADPETDPEAAPETPPRPGIVRDRRRRRRVLFAFLLAAFILAVFLGLVALISDHAASSAPPPRAAATPAITVPAAPPTPPPIPQLPRGGTTIFPNYRVVAYYGTADSDRLGVLGAGTPEQAATKLEQAAAPFASAGRTVQPAMELIVGVADGGPGPDGDYHHDIDQNAARQYLAAARAHKQLMIIDIQPGRTDFMTAVRPWADLLKEPDVSLALDPEWRMPPGQVPGQQIGTVSADEINQVSTWLAGMVAADNLPQKLFVVHQFTSNMITNPERLATPPQLAVVQHIDGFGAPPNKLGKYKDLQRPAQMHLGFKLFYTQDTPMLSPQQALALAPAPDLVTYH